METYLEKWMSSLEFSDFNEGMEYFFPGLDIDGKTLLFMVMEGKVAETAGLLAEQFLGSLKAEIMGLRELFLCIVVLGIVSALFAEFSDLFAGQQMSQAGFYFLYLLLIAVLTKVFLHVSEIAATAISTILLFVKIFIPTYFVAVSAAQVISTAAYYYYLTLLAAYLVESILSTMLIPFIYSYVLLALLGGLWPEEKLSLLLDFMQKGINLVLKILIGIMTGLSLVQALILPVADGLKISAVHKSLSALPGIGGVAGSVTDLFMGSAVLIKNSVGVLLLILLLAVCMLPLGKIALFSGLVKLGAAISGIVSDKRISGATNRVGEGCFMLLKCVGTSMAMFFVVIAIVAYTLTG